MLIFDPDVIVAGKTGTCSRLGWFASYHVADEPDLVLVVLTKPGSGRRASGVAGQIYLDLYKARAPAETARVSAARPEPAASF